MSRGGIFQRMRSAGLLLALFALAFKAMLPPGFMLDASAGRIAIVLCGDGEALFDLRTGQISHPGDQAPASDDSSGQNCPFALVSAPALAAPTFAEDALAPAFVIAAAPVREAAGVRYAIGPPLPARGPPAVA